MSPDQAEKPSTSLSRDPLACSRLRMILPLASRAGPPRGRALQEPRKRRCLPVGLRKVGSARGKGADAENAGKRGALSPEPLPAWLELIEACQPLPAAAQRCDRQKKGSSCGRPSPPARASASASPKLADSGLTSGPKRCWPFWPELTPARRPRKRHSDHSRPRQIGLLGLEYS